MLVRVDRMDCSEPSADVTAGKDDLDDLRAGNDVSVGDDVAGRVDDEAGTNGALAPDDHAGVAALAFQRSVAGNQNLHHAGRYLLDKRVNGFVELVERVSGAILGSGGQCGQYKDSEEAQCTVGGLCGDAHRWRSVLP